MGNADELPGHRNRVAVIAYIPTPYSESRRHQEPDVPIGPPPCHDELRALPKIPVVARLEAQRSHGARIHDGARPDVAIKRRAAEASTHAAQQTHFGRGDDEAENAARHYTAQLAQRCKGLLQSADPLFVAETFVWVRGRL